MEQYEFELIPVPADALREIGIVPGTLAEAFVDGNRLVIQKPDEDAFCGEFDEDCDGCPYCCPECGECLKKQLDEYYGEDDEND